MGILEPKSRDLPVLCIRRPVHAGSVGSFVVLCVVAMSLSTVLAYVAVFSVFAVKTALARRRTDPLDQELDRFLEEVLGEHTAARAAAAGTGTGTGRASRLERRPGAGHSR